MNSRFQKNFLLSIIFLISTTALFAVRVGNKVVANAVTIRQSGSLDVKIYAAGFARIAGIRHFITTAYNISDGSLDTTFAAPNGYITHTFANSTDQVANAIGVQTFNPETPEQTQFILVAGYATVNNQNRFAIVRYTSQGQLDATFGNGGEVQTLIGNGSSINAMIILPDNSFIVAGTALVFGTQVIALARYLPNGTLDISFGNNGIVTTEVLNRASANAMAFDQNGIIVAGQAAINKNDVMFASYSFGGALQGLVQIVPLSPNQADYATGVILGPLEQDITISGAIGKDFMLARFNRNTGELDTTFSGDGVVRGIPDLQGRFNNLILNITDSKIIAVGFTAQNQIIIARFLPNGTIDGSFGGGNGYILIDQDQKSAANDVVLQADGKIVAAGFICNDMALVRALSNGTLDSSFSGDGIVRDPTGAPCLV